MEGQYSLYVSWAESERNIVYRSPTRVEVEGEEMEVPPELDEDGESDVTEETMVHMQPVVEVLPAPAFDVTEPIV